MINLSMDEIWQVNQKQYSSRFMLVPGTSKTDEANRRLQNMTVYLCYMFSLMGQMFRMIILPRKMISIITKSHKFFSNGLLQAIAGRCVKPEG